MVLESPRLFPEFLAAETAPVRLLAHPGGCAPGCWPRVARHSRAALAVGPEGGFTKPEVEAAGAAGWPVVDLGPTLLRIETAALVGAALILALVPGECAS